MPNKVLIIQARMSSTRLPGKTMMPLAGEPLIYRMVERILDCKKIDLIVIATSKEKEDLVIQDVAKELNVEFFQGNLLDVRERYFEASKKYNADYILRIPADNPLPDHVEIDRLIDFHLNVNPNGFSSNLAQINKSGYLDGVGAEMFSFKLLKDSIEKFDNMIVKEHVHRNFYDYSTQHAVDEIWCPISSPAAPNEIARPDIVLDVNTLDDYIRMKDIYDSLYSKTKKFTTIDVINYLDWKNNVK